MTATLSKEYSCMPYSYTITITHSTTANTMCNTVKHYHIMGKIDRVYEHFSDIYHALEDFELILIKIGSYDDNLKEFTSYLKQFILSCNRIQLISVLQFSVPTTTIKADPRKEALLYIIIYHELSVTNQPERFEIDFSELIQELLILRGQYMTEDLNKYLNVYYDNMPESEVFNHIENIWFPYPYLGMTLKLLYCEKLLMKNKMEEFKMILYNNKHYFLSDHIILNLLPYDELKMNVLTVLFYITSINKQTTNDTLISTSLTSQLQKIMLNKMTSTSDTDGYLYQEVRKCCLVETAEHTLSSSKLCVLFADERKEYTGLQLQLVLLLGKKLRSKNLYNRFIKHHCQFILFAANIIIPSIEEETKLQYCEMLIDVIHKCDLPSDVPRKAMSTLMKNELHNELFQSIDYFMSKSDKHLIFTASILTDLVQCTELNDEKLLLALTVQCSNKLMKGNYEKENQQLLRMNSQIILSKYDGSVKPEDYCETVMYTIYNCISFTDSLEHIISALLKDDLHEELFTACYQIMQQSETHLMFTCSKKFLDLFPSSRQEDAILRLRIILMCLKNLRKNNYHTSIQLITQHKEFLFSMATKLDDPELPCQFRRQYSVCLLQLLHYYDASNNDINITKAGSAIKQLQVSLQIRLLEGRYEDFCYCFGDNKKCTEEKVKKKSMRKRISLFQTLTIDNQFELCNDIISDIKCIDKSQYNAVVKEVLRYLQTLYKLGNRFDIWEHPIAKENLITVLSIKYNKDYVNLSRLILDVEMAEGDYHLLELAKMLNKDVKKINSTEKIIYKCYCILRQEGKGRKEINIDVYREHFKFISTLEMEEEMEKLTNRLEFLVMLIVLSTCVANGRHHKSAELKKYLAQKYAYDDAILYLLWCSGDVEVNPGPTLKQLKKVSPSIKERNWIHDTCSSVLKLLNGNQVNNNQNKDLWNKKPDNWPSTEPFYDPRNPKGCKHNTDSDTRLLNCLHSCCIDKHINMEQYLTEEINAWRKGKNEQLFSMYICRKEKDVIKEAVENLCFYKDNAAVKQRLTEVNIIIDFDSIQSSKELKPICIAELIRDIKVTLGRISNGLNPLEKHDGLWNHPPEGWEHTCTNIQLYTKAKERPGVEQDKELIDVLISYIEKNKIPVECQPMMTAWKGKKIEEACKLHSVWSNTAIIRHALSYLEIEGLLDNAELKEELEEIGLTINLDSERCKRTPKNKKQKSSCKNNTSKNKSENISCTLQPNPKEKLLVSSQKKSSEKVKQRASINEDSDEFRNVKRSDSIQVDSVKTSGVESPYEEQTDQTKKSQKKKSHKRKNSFDKEDESRDIKRLVLSYEETSLFLEILANELQPSVSPSSRTDESASSEIPDEIINMGLDLSEIYGTQSNRINTTKSSYESEASDSKIENNNSVIVSLNHTIVRPSTSNESGYEIDSEFRGERPTFASCGSETTSLSPSTSSISESRSGSPEYAHNGFVLGSLSALTELDITECLLASESEIPNHDPNKNRIDNFSTSTEPGHGSKSASSFDLRSKSPKHASNEFCTNSPSTSTESGYGSEGTLENETSTKYNTDSQGSSLEETCYGNENFHLNKAACSFPVCMNQSSPNLNGETLDYSSIKSEDENFDAEMEIVELEESLLDHCDNGLPDDTVKCYVEEWFQSGANNKKLIDDMDL